MSLFGFFKKKKNKPEQSNQDAAKHPDQAKPAIECIPIDNGSHGDNFGGLVGFNFLNSEQGQQLINECIALSAMKAPVLENTSVQIKETSFKAGSGDTGRVRIRILQSKGNVISAYPYVKSDYIIPFTTKQVFEWAHSGNLEAEIKGGGRDTFGFGFFATDYAVNGNKYKSQKNLHIKVSAIGLVLRESDLTEINGHKLDDGFASYMPSQLIDRPVYYDFIGVLVAFEPVNLTTENTGYLIKVKLINDENDPEFFTVDMFINRENISIAELKAGMKITGALWFQGEIA